MILSFYHDTNVIQFYLVLSTQYERIFYELRKLQGQDIYNLPKEIVLHKVYSKLLGTNKQTKCIHCMMGKFRVMWLST